MYILPSECSYGAIRFL